VHDPLEQVASRCSLYIRNGGAPARSAQRWPPGRRRGQRRRHGTVGLALVADRWTDGRLDVRPQVASFRRALVLEQYLSAMMEMAVERP
jgi:hypothetical protein